MMGSMRRNNAVGSMREEHKTIDRINTERGAILESSSRAAPQAERRLQQEPNPPRSNQTASGHRLGMPGGLIDRFCAAMRNGAFAAPYPR